LLTDDARVALIKDVITASKESGVKVELSTSDPFMAQIFTGNLRALIGNGVDLVFCIKDGALASIQIGPVDEACDGLKQSAKTFAVTNGAQDAIVFNGQGAVSVPGIPADVVDTNDAGDMCAGSFIMRRLRTVILKGAEALANKSAARVAPVWFEDCCVRA